MRKLITLLISRKAFIDCYFVMGNKRKKNKGFTLVEVIMTGAILAFGIVSIYEALFVSMDVYGYYTHYLNTQDWISEKIWEVQSELTNLGTITAEQTSGKIVRDHKSYDWLMAVVSLDETQGLYRVKVTLSWREGSKTVSTTRETYLLSPQLIEYNEKGAV